MKKILAFAGSNHSMSINYQLINFTASLLDDYEVNVLDLRNWDIPIYSIDMDPDQTPEKISELITLINDSDAYLMASPEHNGGTPAFFKNILDWLSRRSQKIFNNKPLFLMSTSPGGKGGATNLAFLKQTLPYQGATIAATFSLASFNENFTNQGVTGEQLDLLKERLAKFKESL